MNTLISFLGWLVVLAINIWAGLLVGLAFIAGNWNGKSNTVWIILALIFFGLMCWATYEAAPFSLTVNV